MKKLILIMAVFMAACSGERDRSYDDRFTPYTPEHIDQIGQAVFALNGLEWSDYSIRFYVGSDDDTQLLCGQISGTEHHINGCNFPDEDKIFMAEYTKDWCQIIVHELTHQALFYKNGEADSDHHNDQFGVVSTSDLCLGLNLFP